MKTARVPKTVVLTSPMGKDVGSWITTERFQKSLNDRLTIASIDSTCEGGTPIFQRGIVGGTNEAA